MDSLHCPCKTKKFIPECDKIRAGLESVNYKIYTRTVRDYVIIISCIYSKTTLLKAVPSGPLFFIFIQYLLLQKGKIGFAIIDNKSSQGCR